MLVVNYAYRSTVQSSTRISQSWYNYTKARLVLIWSIVHQPGTPITIKIGPCWRGYNIDSQSSSLSWESWRMKLDWMPKAICSLEERRNRADLIEVYKLMHRFSDIPVSTYFQIATDSCTRGHTKKLVKSHCHTDARLCFFSLRVVNRWNSLSQEIVNAPSVNAFKRHLELLRQKKMGYFMDSQSA